MNKMFLTIATAGLLLGSTGMAFADNPPEGRIKQRKENQQTRIGNGVKNGTLTPKETAHLEHQQSKLNKEIRTERKQNGGNLTNKEKAQINRQQNHLSRSIYKQKHDGQHQ